MNIKEEIALAQKLLEAGMAKLMEESAVPVGPDAKLLVGGWFAVAHTRERERLVFDRRPQNSIEESLGWLRLPSGSQLIHMEIGEHEVVRGTGGRSRMLVLRLASSPRVCGQELRRPPASRQRLLDYGATAGRDYRLALTVVAMGDVNGRTRNFTI